MRRPSSSRCGSAVLALASFVLCALDLSGQTFTVGPAGSFPDIGAALAAVPDGATLVVAPGTYPTFAVSSKGITILGAAGVDVLAGCTVSGTTAAQQVVLSRLRFVPGPVAAQSLQVSNCLGPVLLTGCDTQQSPALSTSFDVSIVRSRQVMIRGCAHRSIYLDLTGLVIEDSVVSGVSAFWGSVTTFPSMPAVRGNRSTVRVRGGSFVGGGGIAMPSGIPGQQADSPAFDMVLGTLRIAGPATVVHPAVVGPGSAIVATASVVEVDPAVVLRGGSAPIAPMPELRSTDAPLGGIMTASGSGPAGAVAVLVMGLPGPPITAPGIAGELWLDPARPGLFASWGTGAVTAGLTVPNVANLRGVVVGWQVISCAPGLACQASNASWSVVLP